MNYVTANKNRGTGRQMAMGEPYKLYTLSPEA